MIIKYYNKAYITVSTLPQLLTTTAPLQRASSQKRQSFVHFTHPNHPVTEFCNAQEYVCDACNTLGEGMSYRCSMCNFNPHEYCATCPKTIGFHLHPQHVLTLVNQAGMGHVCDLCGENVDGLFYTCRVCDFDAHPLCTEVESHVQPAYHPQHLLMLQLAEPGWCMMCHHACTLWRYRCHGCNVDVHLECAFGSPVMASWVPPPTPSAGYAIGVKPNEAMGQVGNQVQNGGAVNGRRRRKICSIVGKTATSLLIHSTLGV